jgi:hypothetical protein
MYAFIVTTRESHYGDGNNPQISAQNEMRLLTATIRFGYDHNSLWIFALDNVGPNLLGVSGDGDRRSGPHSRGESGLDFTAFMMLRR